MLITSRATASVRLFQTDKQPSVAMTLFAQNLGLILIALCCTQKSCAHTYGRRLPNLLSPCFAKATQSSIKIRSLSHILGHPNTLTQFPGSGDINLHSKLKGLFLLLLKSTATPQYRLLCTLAFQLDLKAR